MYYVINLYIVFKKSQMSLFPTIKQVEISQFISKLMALTVHIYRRTIDMNWTESII